MCEIEELQPRPKGRGEVLQSSVLCNPAQWGSKELHCVKTACPLNARMRLHFALYPLGMILKRFERIVSFPLFRSKFTKRVFDTECAARAANIAQFLRNVDTLVTFV